MNSPLPYRPDIDGLRAISIIAVLIFHAYPTILPGGYLGVDIFFVISGFLITQIIVTQRVRGRFSLRDFYVARVTRLVPPLLFLLLCLLPLAWLLLYELEFADLRFHMAGAAAFVTNFIQIAEAGYFDGSSASKPLLHLWSLGVEEQFYLVWPIFLGALYSVRHKLRPVAVLIALIGCSLVYDLWLRQNAPIHAFYSPLCRAWELLTGAALTFFSPAQTRWLTHIRARTLGILLILLAFFLGDAEVGFYWQFAAVLGAQGVIGTGRVDEKDDLLAHPLMVGIGKISYPLYLWHWPLLVVLHLAFGLSHGVTATAIGLSVLMSLMSYHGVERWFRHNRQHQGATAGLILGLAAVGGIGGSTGEWRHLRDTDAIVFGSTAIQAAYYYNPTGNAAYPAFGGYYRYQSRAENPTLMLLGDSHANRLVAGLETHSGENVLHLGHHACPALYGLTVGDACSLPTAQAWQVLHAAHSITTVVIAFRWDYYLGTRPQSVAHSTLRPELDAEDSLQLALQETLTRLEAAGKKVVLVLDNPTLSFNMENCDKTRPAPTWMKAPAQSCAFDQALVLEAQQRYRAMVRAAAAEHANVRTYDTLEALCDGQSCYAKIDNETLYTDSDHLSVHGSMVVGRGLSKLLAEWQPTPK